MRWFGLSQHGNLLSLGIVGGTFDPIHYGHLSPIIEATKKLKLKLVHFVPAANPPHRSSPAADSHHRLEMVKLALDEYPEFVADDREMKRTGKSYTLNTLESFREEFGKEITLMMFIGVDAFREFNTWHQWQKIPDLVHIIVITRPGYSFIELDELTDKSDDKPVWNICHDIGQLYEQTNGLVFFLPVTPVDISATKIRELLAAHESGNKDFSRLMPPVVYNYINQHNLYAFTKSEHECSQKN